MSDENKLKVEGPMMENADAQEFRDSGLLQFINGILHLFGWAIVYFYDQPVAGQPAKFLGMTATRTKFRGFKEKQTDAMYRNLTRYMAEQTPRLLEDVESEAGEPKQTDGLHVKAEPIRCLVVKLPRDVVLGPLDALLAASLEAAKAAVEFETAEASEEFIRSQHDGSVDMTIMYASLDVPKSLPEGTDVEQLVGELVYATALRQRGWIEAGASPASGPKLEPGVN